MPGGTAAYPSSVVMNVVPAQVAGVERIVVATPPRTLSENPAVAAAFIELGITEVYAVGGAQAIAALAFGTETVPHVDKITGPGNRYVAAAKKLVFGITGIDAIAGPTEVVIVADDTARADFIAADLLAQAEHGEDASAILITNSEELANDVAREVERQAESLPRREIVERSLKEYGAIVSVETLEDACEIVNELAPEHVELVTNDDESIAARIRHAGAIFYGAYTPEAVGDYIAGPNHVLPTGRTARFSSALGVYDFVKRTSLLCYSAEAFGAVAESVAVLAECEGLVGHARSASIRGHKEAQETRPDVLQSIKPRVRELRAYSLSPHRASVKLNQNENPWDAPSRIKEEVLRRFAARKWSRYPDFVPKSLHERLAEFARWKADGIIAGNGSNELIQALLLVTIAAGKTVLISEPTFALYRQVATVLGGRVESIPLTRGLQYDSEALQRTVADKQPDVTIICSPNNPTGCVIDESCLRTLLKTARGLVVIDEAYHEFADETVVPLLNEYENLVVLRTFSKAMAFAGLRIGYLLAAPDLVREIRKAVLPYNLNAFSQIAAEVAVANYGSELRPLVQKIIAERERVFDKLSRVNGLTPVPSKGNFMVIKSATDVKRIFTDLLGRDILIRDVSGYPMLSDYFRVSIGTPEENDLLLEALR